MPMRLWLEQARQTLLQRGLPEHYVDRLLTEWSDHEAESNSPTTLGLPANLLMNAVREYRRGRFAGERPLLAFVVLPVVLVILVGAMYTVVAEVVLQGLSWLAGTAALPVMTWATVVAMHLLGFVTPMAVLALCRALQRNAGRPRVWFLSTCGLVMILAAFLVGRCELPTATSPAGIFIETELPVTVLPFAQSLAILLVAVFLTWPRKSRTVFSMA
jgi:hypothetical protein